MDQSSSLTPGEAVKALAFGICDENETNADNFFTEAEESEVEQFPIDTDDDEKKIEMIVPDWIEDVDDVGRKAISLSKKIFQSIPWGQEFH